MGAGEIFGWAAALLSAIASALAWAARLLWGREFAAAKDETIRAKEAQLATKDEAIRAKEAQIMALTDRLREEKELNPMKIREYFVSVKQQLEEYIERLKGDLTKAEEQLGVRQRDIEAERSKSAGKQDQIKKLEAEKSKLQQVIGGLQKQVDRLQVKQSESADVLTNLDLLSKPLFMSNLTDLTEIDLPKIKIPTNFWSSTWLDSVRTQTFPFTTIGEPMKQEPSQAEGRKPTAAENDVTPEDQKDSGGAHHRDPDLTG